MLIFFFPLRKRTKPRCPLASRAHHSSWLSFCPHWLGLISLLCWLLPHLQNPLRAGRSKCLGLPPSASILSPVNPSTPSLETASTSQPLPSMSPPFRPPQSRLIKRNASSQYLWQLPAISKDTGRAGQRATSGLNTLLKAKLQRQWKDQWLSGAWAEGRMNRSPRVFKAMKTILYVTVTANTRHCTFDKTQRMYNAKSEP